MAQLFKKVVEGVRGLSSTASEWGSHRPPHALPSGQAPSDAPPIVVPRPPAATASTLTYSAPSTFFHGVAGVANLTRLASAAGVNAVRVWGVDQLPEPILKEATGLGLAVIAGIWLEPGDLSPAHVAQQVRTAQEQVRGLRKWSCIRAWLIGNECELRAGGAPVASVLAFVDAVARAVKEIDPARPTATALAGVGHDKAAAFKATCRYIDILGINTYTGATDLATALAQQGFSGPYFLAEFGGAGQWEAPKTPWGAAVEPSSTEKCRTMVQAYRGGVLPCLPQVQAVKLPAAGSAAAAGAATRSAPPRQAAVGGSLQEWKAASAPVCIGTFAFFGGCKVEVTPTWYSLFLANGEPVIDRVTVLAWLRQGFAPDPREVGDLLGACLVPHIDSIRAIEPVHAVRPHPTLKPGETVAVQALLRAHGPWEVEWAVMPEVNMTGVGGHGAAHPPVLSSVRVQGTNASVCVPTEPGLYRLYAFVRATGRWGCATANWPFQVK